MSLIEKEGFNCPYCGLELEDPEGYAFHVETHLMIQKEDEELAAETSSEKPETKPSKAESKPKKEKEELSESEIITPIKITVLAEEAEMKDYGYKAPKVPEQLAKEDLDIQAKSWFIRSGMVHMTKFLMGLEDWDKDAYYTPYRKEFNPSQYEVFGLNLEIKDDRTKEEVEKLSEELKTLKKDFDPSDLQIALRPLNQFGEKIKEELSKDSYQKLAKKILGRFLAAWKEEGKSRTTDHNNPLHRTKSFDNQTLMFWGKPVFLRFKCPEKTCDFNLRGKKDNLSDLEKYAILLRHYVEAHLSKLEGTVHPLSVMMRATVGETQSEEALLEKVKREEFIAKKPGKNEGPSGPLMPHQTGSPNPEQCSRTIVTSLLRKASKEKKQKILESLSKEKKATKDDKFLKAIEAKSSVTRRKSLHKEKD